LTAGELKIAPFICYEIVYPALVRSQIVSSDLLVTISNDSWFGQSIGPLQHLQMARMRALENGRYLVRGTNNGVSAIIDERGKIIAQTRQFEAATLVGDAMRYTGQTPFTRFGSLPVLLICSALLFGAALQHRSTRPRHP
jgi:apolipoprotein N-acyltransferase